MGPCHYASSESDLLGENHFYMRLRVSHECVNFRLNGQLICFNCMSYVTRDQILQKLASARKTNIFAQRNNNTVQAV
jgi:hypothetical protein